jgi:uncharacterized membrane protein YeaQ/YmgE (transglycosylase-associated protein family)
MELKLHCDCGQKYKFDVEPVNGQMPFTVACPICRQDGTAKANVLLRQMSVFTPVETPSVPASAPIAPPPISAPPPAPSGAPRLRINMAAHAEPTPAAVAPPPIAPPSEAASRPASAGTRFGAVPAAEAVEPGKKPNFWMGLLGAFVGAAVGAIIYFFIYKATGPLILLRYVLAIGVGGLTGWLANLLGKGEGSKELGGLAAVLTIVGIVGAQYFLELNKWHSDEDLNKINQGIEDGGYSAAVKEAKVIIAAIPNGTDSEIRMYKAKQQTDEGQRPKLEQVSNDEVLQFRNEELTNYQDLASGKITKEQYWTKTGFDPKEAKKLLDTEETIGTGVAAILAVFKAGIFSMIAGAALAFKLSSNN